MARSASLSTIKVRPLEITVSGGAASIGLRRIVYCLNNLHGRRVIGARLDHVPIAPALHLMAHVGGDDAVERLEGPIVSGVVVQIVCMIKLSRMEVDAYAAGRITRGRHSLCLFAPRQRKR